MRPVPSDLLDFIDRHSFFYVIGHKEPDGDCVGSQLALASFLRRTGKSATVLSAGPFTRTEIMAYENRFSPIAPPELPHDRAAALILDCSSLQRIGAVRDTLPSVPIAFIDHHAAGSAVGEVVYIDDRAPSVTAMILLLIEAMGQSPTKEEAELLLFGLATDSGFFRHLDEGSSETFLASSRLVSAGASPKKVFHMMYGGKSLISRKLMGEIL
ncbi:MAG: DHH family phosphoesterase, partial [Spirochaetaceae bacterium]|nr:DHH family phosphoesterase [Spirochaetaceae bacterium]